MQRATSITAKLVGIYLALLVASFLTIVGCSSNSSPSDAPQSAGSTSSNSQSPNPGPASDSNNSEDYFDAGLVGTWDAYALSIPDASNESYSEVSIEEASSQVSLVISSDKRASITGHFVENEFSLGPLSVVYSNDLMRDGSKLSGYEMYDAEGNIRGVITPFSNDELYSILFITFRGQDGQDHSVRQGVYFAK